MKPTVTVHTADLHRLLLAFRDAIEHPNPRDKWWHMHDWDVSFEQLADAVEEACGEEDDRIRCKPTYSCYDWSDFEEAVPVNVKSGSLTGTPPRLRHLAERGDGEWALWDAFCGMSFVDDDVAKKPKSDYAPCPVCAREARLRGIPGPQTGEATCLAR